MLILVGMLKKCEPDVDKKAHMHTATVCELCAYSSVSGSSFLSGHSL